MTNPASKNVHSSPSYHSICGQQLSLVDWKRLGVEVSCPNCNNTLKNDRTNFSKNKTLFPIFHMSGRPSWCMVMSMQCTSCFARCDANDGVILSRLPAYAAAAHPVDTRHALHNKNSHVGRCATDAFDLLMTTYGNGEMCSRLLHNGMNREHLTRVSDCCSHNNTVRTDDQKKPPNHLRKDGECITCCPPLGDNTRDVCDEASLTENTPWGISDCSRHTREIQGVGCRLSCAEDHTHEVTKNHFRRTRIGAVALWDIGTDTGETASAAIVPTTRTSDLSHAATQVSRRKNFNPSALCSNRWPTKEAYWTLLFGDKVVGRLGPFHCIQRITRTIRKRHADHCRALNLLLDAICICNQQDCERVLNALKTGTIGGRVHDDDISCLKSTKQFRKRHGKHLRKEIRPPNAICERLDDWFIQFKVTASEGSRPALGRLDPTTKEPLFTSETKEAMKNCKLKAQHLQDPLPIDRMHSVTPPNPNSRQRLPECLSHRDESNLEAFHLMLAHFGNNGMRESLADNLNLTGTARHNLAIRHKMRLSRMTDEKSMTERSRTPSAWEPVVSCYNHTELEHINQMARSVGHRAPFDHVEQLVEDTGEVFFSKCLKWLKNEWPKSNEKNDLCLCLKCNDNTMLDIPQQQKAVVPPTLHTNSVSNVPANQQTVALQQQRPLQLLQPRVVSVCLNWPLATVKMQTV